MGSVVVLFLLSLRVQKKVPQLVDFHSIPLGKPGADVDRRLSIAVGDKPKSAPTVYCDPALYMRLGLPAKLGGTEDLPGQGLAFFSYRFQTALTHYDGLRVDHPQGIVCPWVYRTHDPDPFRAVLDGARLLCSPDVQEHRELAAYAIPRAAQIAHDLPRYADGWVASLDADQVVRYAIVFDTLADLLAANGALKDRIICEVLSSQPYPLARIMERHGLGRFRVTPKADLEDSGCVHRADTARPEDWVMVGNHDTEPIWKRARSWLGTAEGDRQAAHLARILVPEERREAAYNVLRSDRTALVHAKVAELLVSPARNVLVFFADLLGMEEVYNRPGVLDEANWSLQVPSNFAESYAKTARQGCALDLTCAIALAFRASRAGGGDSQALVDRLETLSRYRLSL